MIFSKLFLVCMIVITTSISEINAAVDECFLTPTSECGQAFTGWSGEFSSPNFPADYPNDVNCVWQITGPIEDSTIYLEFNGSFVTANEEDYLVIVDEEDRDSPDPLYMFGTDDNPVPIQSESRFLWACFHTNNAIAARGFKAHFTVKGATPETSSVKPSSSVEPSPTVEPSSTVEPSPTVEPSSTVETSTSPTTSCGGILDKPWGTFNSPQFPMNYPLDVDCEWVFNAPEGSLVHITLAQHLTIERSPNCELDYLEFRNGPNSDSTLMTTICRYHDEPIAITSNTNRLYAKFHSDDQFNYQGFVGLYHMRRVQVLQLEDHGSSDKN